MCAYHQIGNHAWIITVGAVSELKDVQGHRQSHSLRYKQVVVSQYNKNWQKTNKKWYCCLPNTTVPAIMPLPTNFSDLLDHLGYSLSKNDKYVSPSHNLAQTVDFTVFTSFIEPSMLSAKCNCCRLLMTPSDWLHLQHFTVNVAVCLENFSKDRFYCHIVYN